MTEEMKLGAKIVIYDWIRIRPWDKVLIVTTQEYRQELKLLQKYALKKTCSVNSLIVENSGKHVGVFFDRHESIFDPYTAVIAATDYSLVTTKAVKRAIQKRKKVLSLPLSTNDGRSMLEYEFMKMDTKKSRLMAQAIMKYLHHCREVRVTTPAGTDLHLYMEKRKPGFFNGVVSDGRGYSSASIEVYSSVEETKTWGVMVLDGSLGYIGKADEPTRILFEKGRITDIEQTVTGKILTEYMDDFHDCRIYIAGELGIGLNTYARCLGNCYIEDESSYGTFHIGVGRNLALGGMQNANGHFDLVCKEPDIYVDNRKIMELGRIILPEDGVYIR